MMETTRSSNISIIIIVHVYNKQGLSVEGVAHSKHNSNHYWVCVSYKFVS